MTREEILNLALLQATEEGVGINLAKFADMCIEWATNVAVDKACEWLEEELPRYVFEGRENKPYISVAMIDDFKATMKGD